MELIVSIMVNIAFFGAGIFFTLLIEGMIEKRNTLNDTSIYKDILYKTDNPGKNGIIVIKGREYYVYLDRQKAPLESYLSNYLQDIDRTEDKLSRQTWEKFACMQLKTHLYSLLLKVNPALDKERLEKYFRELVSYKPK